MEKNWHKSPPDPQIQILRGDLADSEWTASASGYRGVVLISGSGVMKVGGKITEFSAPCLVWLRWQDGATLRAHAGSRGATLLLSEAGFVHDIGIGTNASAIRGALSQSLLNARIELKEARRLMDGMEAVFDEFQAEKPGFDEVVRHHVGLILFAAWRLSGPILRETRPLPHTIMHRFMQVVEVRLHDQWSIARYADAIGITVERLNIAVRRASGKSPLAIIHNRLTAEAVELLVSSSLRVADIADALGFHDPAYFSRFFKRQTGHSPNAYRNGIVLRERGIASFSAWP